jgi:hypothetical protein
VTVRSGVLDVHVHGVTERIMCARRCSCCVLQRSWSCVPHVKRSVTLNGYAPTELEQLRSDGDGFLCLLYVHRVGSMTPCTCTSRTPLRAVSLPHMCLDAYSTTAALNGLVAHKQSLCRRHVAVPYSLYRKQPNVKGRERGRESPENARRGENRIECRGRVACSRRIRSTEPNRVQ